MRDKLALAISLLYSFIWHFLRMKISHLDHLVLTVKDIDVSVDFYQRVLGMKKEIFAGDRFALKFGQQKINLHQAGNEFEPKAKLAMPGTADLCFVCGSRLQQAMQHVESCGVEILEGPVARTGAMGKVSSFYFRDPDENLIEGCCY